MPIDQVLVPYREGFNYGMGVRSSTGSPLALGVTGTASSAFGGGGDTGAFHLSRVESTADMEDSLKTSAEASGGVGLFSASARFDFARNAKIHVHSLTLMVSATLQKSFQQIDTPVLATDAANLVSTGKLDMFAERYGDRFVRGAYLGGQFFGIFRIETKDETSRQNIDTALGGSYGLLASADVKVKIDQACQQYNGSVSCDAYWEGGRVQAQPITPDGLLQCMQQWTSTVQDLPVPYWVSLVPYAIAQGPEPPNVEDLQHQRDVLKQCARMRSQTLDRLNQVEYILDPLHTPEFNIQPPPSGPDLPALHAGLSADLDMIAAAASWACDHPKEAMDPETFAHTHQIVSVPGWINPHFDPNYKMTILPTNMPLHVGVQVLVPDFSIARSFDEATKIASDSRLNLHWDTDTNVVDPNFRILNQDPARATPVSWGSTVILTVPDNGLHFPPGWHPGGGGIHFRANGLLLSKDVPHRGFSLHIGLNGVDASKYNGWAGTLAGCVNDANAMQSVCRLQGFDAQTLLNSEATADAILGAIGQAAFNLQSGETLVLSFSGHGGQVPDITGISPSGLDDTWVAYDRMILGHELYNLWGQFASDVRIEVYSDSCHSGTVIRDLFTRWPTSTSKAIPSFLNGPETQNFQIVYGPAARTEPTLVYAERGPKIGTRVIPADIALAVFKRDQKMYEAAQWSRKRGEITASVILISGCQDNQESADGQSNGLFTEKLLAVWNNGSFSGTLPQFHQAIVALMPPSQTPNYFTLGVNDDLFTNSRPLTIVESDQRTTTNFGTEPVDDTPPVVTSLPSYDRAQEVPPSFVVGLGSNPYYVFEITSDPACFIRGPGGRKRTPNNFYASWNDQQAPARNTNSHYILPSYAWKRLRANDNLYFRVGTTTSGDPDHWENYLVSTTDGDAASAPSIIITSAKMPAPRPLVMTY